MDAAVAWLRSPDAIEPGQSGLDAAVAWLRSPIAVEPRITVAWLRPRATGAAVFAVAHVATTVADVHADDAGAVAYVVAAGRCLAPVVVGQQRSRVVAVVQRRQLASRVAVDVERKLALVFAIVERQLARLVVVGR
jgi:hypothetical protein